VRGVFSTAKDGRAFLSRAPGLGWRLLDLIVLLQTFLVLGCAKPGEATGLFRFYKLSQVRGRVRDRVRVRVRVRSKGRGRTMESVPGIEVRAPSLAK